MTPQGSVQVEIHVGAFEVLTSGVLHVEDGREVLIKVSNLKIGLEFKSDDGVPRFVGRAMEDDAKKLTLDFFNHDNPLGQGVFQPFEVAKIDGRSLSMTYFSSRPSMEKNSRTITYALYLGDQK